MLWVLSVGEGDSRGRPPQLIPYKTIGGNVEWAQIPVVQLGAVGVLLAVLWLVFSGRLVPRSTLEDVRADRDARVSEAASDADDWRELYVSEHQAHELTRRAHAEEMRAALLASTEGAQVAATLLDEVRSRQIEAGQ